MRVKEIIKIVVVSIVILGMLLTYGLSSFTTQTPEPASDFAGPTGDPYATGPTSLPSANGPTTPPPGN